MSTFCVASALVFALGRAFSRTSSIIDTKRRAKCVNLDLATNHPYIACIRMGEVADNASIYKRTFTRPLNYLTASLYFIFSFGYGLCMCSQPPSRFPVNYRRWLEPGELHTAAWNNSACLTRCIFNRGRSKPTRWTCEPYFYGNFNSPTLWIYFPVGAGFQTQQTLFPPPLLEANERLSQISWEILICNFTAPLSHDSIIARARESCAFRIIQGCYCTYRSGGEKRWRDVFRV